MSTADASGAAALSGAGVAAELLRVPLTAAAVDLQRIVGTLRGAATAVGRVRTSAAQAVGVLRQLKSAVDSEVRGLVTAGRGATGAGSGLAALTSGVKAARTSLGRLDTALGGALSLIGGMLASVPRIAQLMDTFGKVAAVVQAVMTAVNLLSKTTPLGAVTSLLLPLISQLIDLAVNSQTGQRIIEQVFDQGLRLFQQILGFLGPVLKVYATVVSTYLGVYLTTITTVLTVVSGLLGGDFPAVRAAVSSATTPLHGTMSAAWRGLQDAVKPVLTFFTRDIPGAFRRIGGAVGNTFSGIGGFVRTGLQAVVSVLKGPLDGIIGFANWIIDGLNSLGFSFLGKHFGVHLSKIPMLAAGGVVLPATARSASRVLPLSDLQRRHLLATTRRTTTADGPTRLAAFHERPGDSARGIAEDLLFLAAAHHAAPAAA
jgi:hypothetical protein